MPKVLRIINRFNLGGPTYNATFLTGFIDDSFETKLVGGVHEEDETDSLHIPAAYGVVPILLEEMHRTPNLKSDYIVYKKLKAIIREYQPDIVHTHAAKAGALGRMAAKSCGVPVIVHTYHGHVFHSYFGKIKSTIYKIIERRLAAISDGIIAISPLQANELAFEHKICKLSKIETIRLGFDLRKFQENIDVKRITTRDHYKLEENVAVAIVGRLTPIKNHDLFLDVVEHLAAKNIYARYFIVGDGSEFNRLQKRVSEINDRFALPLIEMTSWITDIASFNAGMDVICLTSDNEGTPVSLIEAQACNVPVVSTDVGGVKDIILDGETGFVVPKNDVQAFAEKLELLICQKEIRQKMSQNGWKFVENQFDYRTLVKNMENYYSRLMKQKGLCE